MKKDKKPRKKQNFTLGKPSKAPRKPKMPNKVKIRAHDNFKNANLGKMLSMNTYDWKTRSSILEYGKMRKEVRSLENWEDYSLIS